MDCRRPHQHPHMPASPRSQGAGTSACPAVLQHIVTQAGYCSPVAVPGGACPGRAPVLTSYRVSSVRTAYAWPRVREKRGWSRIFRPTSQTRSTAASTSVACAAVAARTQRGPAEVHAWRRRRRGGAQGVVRRRSWQAPRPLANAGMDWQRQCAATSKGQTGDAASGTGAWVRARQGCARQTARLHSRSSPSAQPAEPRVQTHALPGCCKARQPEGGGPAHSAHLQRGAPARLPLLGQRDEAHCEVSGLAVLSRPSDAPPHHPEPGAIARRAVHLHERDGLLLRPCCAAANAHRELGLQRRSRPESAAAFCRSAAHA